MARCGLRMASTPWATIFSASMSRPESVSSRMASFGSSTAICRISLRFFSPPEKPSCTERRPEEVRVADTGNLYWILERHEDAFTSGLLWFHGQEILALVRHIARGDGVYVAASQHL